MKISVAFFIKTLDGKGVGSVGGALSRQVGSVFASLGKLFQLWCVHTPSSAPRGERTGVPPKP